MTKTLIARISQAVKDGHIHKCQAAAIKRKGIPDAIASHLLMYCRHQNDKSVDPESIADEVKRCLDFVQTKSSTGKLDDNVFHLIRLMLPKFHKDNLVGKSKRAIYFAYCLYNKYTEPDPDPLPFASNDNEERLNCFVELAYYGCLSNQQLLKLGRVIVNESPDVAHAITGVIKNNPSVLDNYVYKNDDSLLAKLIENKFINTLSSHSEFETFYNWNTHEYGFDVKNSEKHFELREGFRPHYVFNSESVAMMDIDKHPLFEHVLDFAKKHLKKDPYVDSENFTRYSKYWLESDEMCKKIQDCFAILGKQMDVHVSAWSLTIKTSMNYFAQIHYKAYPKITVIGGQDDGWRAECKPSYEVYLFITPDGKIFRKQLDDKSGKYGANRPVSMQEMIMFANKTNLFYDFVRSVIDFYGKNNRFVYDFISDCKQKGCLIPVTFDEVVSCYNRAHFIKSKYKTAQKMKINWNKRNLNLSYMIIKAYPLIEDGIGRRILEQIKDINLLPVDDVGYGAHNKAEQKTSWFIKNVLVELIKESHIKKNSKIDEIVRQCKNEAENEIGTGVLEDELTTFIDEKVGAEIDSSRLRMVVSDYVNMCRQSKKKIRLDIRSTAQLDNLHDFVAHGETKNYYREHTQPVSVPKDSKFNELRKILPDAFEWITNRKRLILETELQHHCVWSYADKISSDRCAIYSFVDSKAEYADDGRAKRYTIEFCQDKKGEYYIQQVQGKYDRMHTQKMADYIQKLLDDAKKEEMSA